MRGKPPDLLLICLYRSLRSEQLYVGSESEKPRVKLRTEKDSHVDHKRVIRFLYNIQVGAEAIDHYADKVIFDGKLDVALLAAEH